MSRRRALVTGATGGLGLALTRALIAEDYEVTGAGRDLAVGEALTGLGARFVAADLTDPQAPARLVAGADVVFHAAALSSPWGPYEAFQAINVEATRRLLQAAREAGSDGFVFISTPSVYSEARDRLGLTEESPLAARFPNAYAATKHAAEGLVRAANAPGFATVSLRPRALVGPDDTVLLPRLARVARRGWFPMFRGGRALIELTDVRDACAAAICADRRRGEVGGRVFNISGGAPASVAATLDLVFAALGLDPRQIETPYPLAAGLCAALEAVCRLLPGQPEPPATVYSLTTLAFSQTFDLSAAIRDLRWRPTHPPAAAIAWAVGGRGADAPV